MFFRRPFLSAAPLALAAMLGGAEPAHAPLWSWFSRDLREVDAQLASLQATLATLPEPPPPQALERAGYHSGFARGLDSIRQVQVDLGSVLDLEAVVVVPAFAPSIGSGPYGFPPRFRIDAAGDADFTDPITLCDHTDADFTAGRAPVVGRIPGLRARFVRFTATRLCPLPGDEQRGFFCLGEILVFADGADVAVGRPITVTTTMETQPVWGQHNLVDGISALGLPVAVDGNRFNGWRSQPSPQAATGKWIQIDLGATQAFDEVRLFPTHAPAFPERTAFGFPLRFNVAVSDEADFAQGRTVFDSGPRDWSPPGDNPVPLPVPGANGRFVRVNATKLWQRSGDYVLSLSEVEVLAHGRNLARGRPVSAIDDAEQTYWTRESLTDGRVATGALVPWLPWLARLADRHDGECRLAALTRRQQEALPVAQRRALWSALATLGAILLAVAVALGRGHAARRRELAELRERIARDLHDEIGSHLGSIALMSELALRPAAAGDAQATLAEIHRLAREAGASMRGIIWLVRERGRPTLQRLAETMRQGADALLRGTACTFTVPADDGRDAPLDVHRHLYLFFREAVHNIARHAQARQVAVTLAWDATTLRLAISDDGRGFDPATAVPGSGLANLRHRAAALGGRLEMVSAPGTGTRITLEVPLA